jgi:chromosome segregation protein
MLKALELFGFKSFAERTRFEFDTGITCVVGPNGSGKSNVVDAIKWILGDQSPKSLRGSEMTDVIFNGSKSARPSGYAEAIISFDNTNNLLPLEASEVQIGRRLYRGGDSEYLINNTSVRLKDVRDLLMGTGAGLSAYNIIEQGRVGQILQGNSLSRRQFIEEAAGISRYKARKQEAEKKLERVNLNLARLQDIVDEVEARLNSTRTHAAKAAKYHEAYTELKTWWLGYAADEFQFASEIIQDCQEKDAVLAKDLEATQAKAEAVETELAGLNDQLTQKDRDVQFVSRQLSAVRESIVEQQATMRYEAQRHVETIDDQGRLRYQRQLLLKRHAEMAARLEQEKARHAELQELTETQKAAETTKRTELGELKAEADRLEKQKIELTRSIQASELRVSQLTQQRSVLAAKQETVRSAIKRNQQQLADLKEVLEDAHAREQQLLSRFDDLSAAQKVQQRSLAELAEKRSRLVERQKELQEQEGQAREKKSGLEARSLVLSELESKQAGLAVGLKEILKRARTVSTAPWNTIKGLVADMMEIDFLHAAVVEVALAERAHWIVTSDVVGLVDHLIDHQPDLSERIGFLDLVGTPAWSGLPDFSNFPGVISRADQLVTSVSLPGSELAERVLGDTWVVENLQIARELSRGTRGMGRFVTLQGELIDRGGVAYLGAVQPEQSVISRRSELMQIRRQTIECEEFLKSAQIEAVEIIRQLKEISTEEQRVRQESLAQTNELNQHQVELQTQQRECGRLEEERARVENDLLRLETHVGGLESDMVTTDEEITNLRIALEEVQTEHSRIEQDVIAHHKQVRVISEELAELQLSTVQSSERLRALVQTIERLDEEAVQRQGHLQEAHRRLEQTGQRIEKSDLVVLNTRAKLDELIGNECRLAGDYEKKSAEKIRVESRRGILHQQDQQLRGTLRGLQEQRYSLDQTTRDHQRTLENLAEKMQEEYQMTLQDVAETRASSYQLYLQERGISLPGSVDADSEQLDEGMLEEIEQNWNYEAVRTELFERVERLRRKLKMIGSVNTDSLKDLQELEGRFKEMSLQLADLNEAKFTLEDIIRKINVESKRLFIETYESVRGQFQILFRQLFGGGEGDIILEDPNDPLECGIDITARPPGKELRSLSLLSGGEKTLTAVGLLFALFKNKPSPFCILDEVDAALDEANIDRYINVLATFKQQTQFVMITHRKRSMTVADSIYGVTMETAGVSKRLSVKLDQVNDNGEIRENKAA